MFELALTKQDAIRTARHRSRWEPTVVFVVASCGDTWGIATLEFYLQNPKWFVSPPIAQFRKGRLLRKG